MEMQRRKRKTAKAVVIWALVFCLGITSASFADHGDNPEDVRLYAQSAVLMDGKSGRILWEQNGETVRPMASTTKIMTCILALEAGLGEADKITEVSAHAAAQPKVHLGMQAGQRFYTRDILYSLMLESHNDSAVAVAEAAAGSVEEFARQRNLAVKIPGLSRPMVWTGRSSMRRERNTPIRRQPRIWHG